MSLNIITHDKRFHADEIMAVALLKVFTNETYNVKRIGHVNNLIEAKKVFRNYDIAIDIGRAYDEDKMLFDHHQYKGGKSSAGLVYSYLIKTVKNMHRYSILNTVIVDIDNNDVGIKKSSPGSIGNIIAGYNTGEDTGIEQEEAFQKALDFCVMYLENVKRECDNTENIKHAYTNRLLKVPGFNNIIDLGKKIPGTERVLISDDYPELEYMIYSKNNGKYAIKTVAKNNDSFDSNATPLPKCDTMKFVHENGFYAVAPSKEVMLTYINNNLYNPSDSSFDDIRNETIELIEKMTTITKNHSDMFGIKGADNVNWFLAESVKQSGVMDKSYSDIELMTSILGYKQNDIDSFTKAIYDVFYKADDANIHKLSLVFPFHGKAFKEHGRTAVLGLEIAIDELIGGNN